ncbi:MAG: cytochrome c oxidase subunit II [Actinomycetota bacterium]|nr:cytochrome c oxidase subunit II [Actinomycetota bacterium]
MRSRPGAGPKQLSRRSTSPRAAVEQPRPWRVLRPRVAGIGLLALALTGCVQNAAQTEVEEPFRVMDYLEPVGRYAIDADRLWNLTLLVAIAIFVLVQALIVVALLRFRERDDDGRSPKQIHGNPRLEALWTVIPALILAAVAVPTVRTIFEFARPVEGALEINVTGHQWWWEYEYLQYENLTTANIMHIPTGQDVVLRMTSADVIHSFWVPKLAGKQDVVPGRTTMLKLYTDEPGEYYGACGEFCGLSHANMRLRVIAHEPAEFDRWAQAHAEPVDTAAVTGQVADGKALFVTKECVGCHTIRGFQLSGDDPEDVSALRRLGLDQERIDQLLEGGPVEATATVGPDLTYFSDRGWFAGVIFANTDENLRAWLEDPPAMKPMDWEQGRGMPPLGLQPDEIDALVAFLRTLTVQR